MSKSGYWNSYYCQPQPTPPPGAPHGRIPHLRVRNRVRRLPDRATYDQEAVFAVLDAALVAHIGYVINGQPFVTPTAFWRSGSRLYWHGWPPAAHAPGPDGGLPVCVTVTHLDGLVLARSAFNHSLNYRSAMVFGTARALPEADRPRPWRPSWNGSARAAPPRPGPVRPRS